MGLDIIIVQPYCDLSVILFILISVSQIYVFQSIFILYIFGSRGKNILSMSTMFGIKISILLSLKKL